jgi:hypothetical protein
MRSRFHLVALLAAAIVAAGCGDSAPTQIAKATKSVQDAVEQAQQTAAQATGISEGSIELTLDAPLKIEQCFARLTPQTAARPGVLQLFSYEDPQDEEFPSVMLWATCDAASASDLVGKTVEGQLFVQRKPGADLWRSSNLVPIAITVVQADLLSVTCEIKDATVERVDDNGQAKASGKLIGLWREAAAKPAGSKTAKSAASTPAKPDNTKPGPAVPR